MNSSRGPGDDPLDPLRPVKRARDASAEEREKYGVDDVGWLVYPATVVEVRELELILEYDDGIDTGVELIQNVTRGSVCPGIRSF